MAQEKIEGFLSTDVVEFQVDGPPAKFTVDARNLSDDFASFRLQLFAPGADPNLGHRWYRLYPEVSTKKPPGDSTEFAVFITETPVPGAETINVTVEISSLEFRDVQRLPIRLIVKAGIGPTRLQVNLPNKHLLVYPAQMVQIPVQVFNPNQKNAEAVLRFSGVNYSWLNEGDQRRVLVGAGQTTEATFTCKLPVAMQAPSWSYPIKVEAYWYGNLAGEDNGILEVVAVGTVMFSCTPKQCWIPVKGKWWPNFSSDPGIYQLQLKNVSNLAQNITIDVQGKDVKRLDSCEVSPSPISCQPGETSITTLTTTKKRPWIGLNQKLQLQIITTLSDQRLGKTDPPRETVELYLRPLLPFWLQFLAALLLLALLLLLFPRESHTGPVMSVKVNGLINLVLSGSEDQTVRAWKPQPNHPLCSWFSWQRYCLEPEGILVDQDNNGTNGKSVTVIQFSPEDNDKVAIGLDNGEILLWNVPQQSKINLFSQQKSDRVFALVFTKDSDYLFSGHGLMLRLWQLKGDRVTPLAEERLGFAIQSLALTSDEKTLIAAGRYNRIFIGDWSDRQQLPSFRALKSPTGSQNDYIYSIAVANSLLAVSDNQGFIRIWDLKQCQPQGESELSCQLIDEWQMTYANGEAMPLRSIDLSQEGDYLVAAGDDGKIVLWKLTSSGKRQPDLIKGKMIAKYATRINSIDLIKGKQLLIVSGSDDHQVRLKSYPLK
jgi:hypothetical protein